MVHTTRTKNNQRQTAQIISWPNKKPKAFVHMPCEKELFIKVSHIM